MTHRARQLPQTGDRPGASPTMLGPDSVHDARSCAPSIPLPVPLRRPGGRAPGLSLRQVVGIVFSLFIFAQYSWAGATLDRIKQSGNVVIAYRTSAVPFSYLSGDGRPIGYAIDICQHLVQAIAQRIGARSLGVSYLVVTSSTRISSIAESKADLECESTTNTAERRRQVAFTIPHYITGARYLVRKESAIEKLSDFRGKTLVSTAGTTPLKAIRMVDQEFMVGIHIGEVPDHVRGIEMVENGEADGFVMDEVLLAGLTAMRPDPTELKIVGKYLTVEPLAIMLTRTDPELKRVLDDEMKRLIRTGEAAALYERWFMKPIPPKDRSLALPMPYLLRDFWRYPSDWVPD